MSRFNILSKKEFFDIKSGEVFYHVTVDQFDKYVIVPHWAHGKKVGYHSTEVKGVKKFLSKSPQILPMVTTFNGEILMYPEYKLTKTTKGAQKLIAEHKNGLVASTALQKVVKRVRKAQTTVTE